jgi:hypothetical protein
MAKPAGEAADGIAQGGQKAMGGPGGPADVVWVKAHVRLSVEGGQFGFRLDALWRLAPLPHAPGASIGIFGGRLVRVSGVPARTGQIAIRLMSPSLITNV